LTDEAAHEINGGMQRILVALDASARAPFVLQTAVTIAGRTGAKLALLRTVGLPPEVDQEVLTHSADTVIDAMTTRAKKELATLAAAAPAGLVDGLHVRIGVPWSAICEQAKDVDADLVVLGSHGYGGLDRILGTTAAKVVNHCDRSVLVARQR
jgi:nucleotide-binding universal stress UspA family protein